MYVLIVQSADNHHAVCQVSGTNSRFIGKAGAAIDEDKVKAKGILNDFLKNQHQVLAGSSLVQTGQIQIL